MSRARRVLLVDDSATSRIILRRMFDGDRRFEIVGDAPNGKVAIQQAARLNPDIVIMDVMMPVLGGIEATAELMATSPRPVLLISELVGEDSKLNFRALQSGALDLNRKPTVSDLEDPQARERFLRTALLLSEIPVITRHRSPQKPSPTRPLLANAHSASVPTSNLKPQTSNPPLRDLVTPARDVELVCIGASTGGPPALLAILTAIAKQASWPVLITQHMSPGFLEGMAKWLSTAAGVEVTLGRPGVVPERGKVYLAPDSAHLEYRAGTLRLDHRPPDRGNRPSVNYMFDSVARDIVASRTVAVLLTGMGEDGANGLLALRQAGAWTIAQDQASSVVYGMPKAARDLGAAQEILPLEEIGPRLLQLGPAQAG